MEDFKNKFANEEKFNCGVWNLTEEEDGIQHLHSWWVQGIASMLVGTIGSLLSIISIIVLSDEKLNRILFNKLVIVMISFDLGYLTCSIYDSLRFNFIETNYCGVSGYIAVFVAYPLRKIFLCCSTYMTVVVAYERFSAVTHPITHRNSSRYASLNLKALKYVSLVVILSILFGIPLFFAFTIENVDGKFIGLVDGKVYGCIAPWLRTHKSFIIIYNNIVNLIITGVLPFAFLSFFYLKIYVSIKDGIKARDELEEGMKMTPASSQKCLIQSQHSKFEEKRTEMVQSVILIWIVISFLICHIPRISLNIEEMLSEQDRIRTMEKAKSLNLNCTGVKFWEMIATDWYYFFLCVNPVMNFFVYCYFSKKFQEVLKKKCLFFISCGSVSSDEADFTTECSFWRPTICNTQYSSTDINAKSTKLVENTQAHEKTPLKFDMK